MIRYRAVARCLHCKVHSYCAKLDISVLLFVIKMSDESEFEDFDESVNSLEDQYSVEEESFIEDEFSGDEMATKCPRTKQRFTSKNGNLQN